MSQDEDAGNWASKAIRRGSWEAEGHTRESFSSGNLLLVEMHRRGDRDDTIDNRDGGWSQVKDSTVVEHVQGSSHCFQRWLHYQLVP